MSETRKVIQLAVMPADSSAFHHYSGSTLYALCDDGSMWAMSKATDEQWLRVKDIPTAPPSPLTRGKGQ